MTDKQRESEISTAAKHLAMFASDKSRWGSHRR